MEKEFKINGKAKQEVKEPVVEKPTFEQLEEFCKKVISHNQYLEEQLQALDMSNTIRRVEFLFRVVENKDSFPESFVSECIKDIQMALMQPQEEEKKEEAK